jgi:hypothetical protein
MVYTALLPESALQAIFYLIKFNNFFKQCFKLKKWFVDLRIIEREFTRCPGEQGIQK